MLQDVKKYTKEILELVKEFNAYLSYRERFILDLNRIYREYQAGIYDYFEYEKRYKNIVNNKTQQEWIDYYDSYLYSLLKKIEYVNSKIFSQVYPDESYLKLKVVKPRFVFFKNIFSKVRVFEDDLREKRAKKEIKKAIEKAREVKKPVVVKLPKQMPVVVEPEIEIPKAKEIPELKPLPEIIKPSPKVEVEVETEKGVRPSLFKGFGKWLKGLFKPHVKKEKVVEKKKEVVVEKKEEAVVKVKEEVSEEKILGKEKPSLWQKIKPLFIPEKKEEKFKPIFKKEEEKKPEKKKELFPKLKIIFGSSRQKILFDQILVEEKKHADEKGTVRFGKIFGIDLLKDILLRKSVKPEKAIRGDLRSKYLKTVEFDDYEHIAKVSPKLLAKEADKVKKVMAEKKKLAIYKPSLIGALANLTTRGISSYLINNFPDFFKSLYNALRLGNIKVLSNTYVNIMVFCSFLSSVIAILFFPLVFFLQFNPILVIMAKTFIVAGFFFLLTFFTFYMYPFMKIKQRNTSINTNLPFAINHMAAVASSGIPPDVLFRLVAESGEYGEICVEAEKIDQFISIFGYDLLTAIKSVSNSTPSPFWREFLEGLVSTVESGGDLQEFLENKSEESMLNYELERQKYVESISTYSDVYTGILIAAPLFFVAALSLISILGGAVGGINVTTIISVGTYIVIPLLNIAFIMFLQFSQPEI